MQMFTSVDSYSYNYVLSLGEQQRNQCPKRVCQNFTLAVKYQTTLILSPELGQSETYKLMHTDQCIL